MKLASVQIVAFQKLFLVTGINCENCKTHFNVSTITHSNGIFVMVEQLNVRYCPYCGQANSIELGEQQQGGA